MCVSVRLWGNPMRQKVCFEREKSNLMRGFREAKQIEFPSCHRTGIHIVMCIEFGVKRQFSRHFCFACTTSKHRERESFIIKNRPSEYWSLYVFGLIVFVYMYNATFNMCVYIWHIQNVLWTALVLSATKMRKFQN